MGLSLSNRWLVSFSEALIPQCMGGVRAMASTTVHWRRLPGSAHRISSHRRFCNSIRSQVCSFADGKGFPVREPRPSKNELRKLHPHFLTKVPTSVHTIPLTSRVQAAGSRVFNDFVPVWPLSSRGGRKWMKLHRADPHNSVSRAKLQRSG